MASSLLLTAAVAIVTAFAGSGIWSFLSSWLNIGAARRKDDITRLIDQAKELKGEVQGLKDELNTCEERHGILETRLRAVEQRNASYFALWIKDRHRRLVWCNDKAFLTLFAPLGYSRDEIDGKTFRDLLDLAAADEIDHLDRMALAHPGTTQSLFIQLHPDLPSLVVIKVAAIADNGEVQYEGCAYHPGDPEIRAAAGTRRQVAGRAQVIDRLIEGHAEKKGASE